VTTEAAFDGSTLALPELSAAAAEFVQQHPDEARVAVTAAQFDSLNRDESRIPAALRPFVVEASPSASDDELIGAEEAVCRLAVSRATVYNWIESQRLLGWRLARQGTLIPAEQILGPGELVPGIERVLEIIPGRAPRGAPLRGVTVFQHFPHRYVKPDTNTFSLEPDEFRRRTLALFDGQGGHRRGVHRRRCAFFACVVAAGRRDCTSCTVPV
jgi:hypothetical protein